RAHLRLHDLPRRGGLRLDVDHLALGAGDHVVVAAVRGVRDAEPVRARAFELARQHLGDVPLERAAEGDDALVAQAVRAAARTARAPASSAAGGRAVGLARMGSSARYGPVAWPTSPSRRSAAGARASAGWRAFARTSPRFP